VLVFSVQYVLLFWTIICVLTSSCLLLLTLPHPQQVKACVSRLGIQVTIGKNIFQQGLSTRRIRQMKWRSRFLSGNINITDKEELQVRILEIGLPQTGMILSIPTNVRSEVLKAAIVKIALCRRCHATNVGLPWRWRKHVPPKHRFLSANLHCVTSQKKVILHSTCL
jgi:hypothetical protein